MKHPALRVTSIKKLFKINRFYGEFALKIDEIFEIFNFYIFLFFSKIPSTFVRIFDLAITYRPEMLVAQIDRLNELVPEMK